MVRRHKVEVAAILEPQEVFGYYGIMIGVRSSSFSLYSREEIQKRLWDDLLQLSEDISVPWLIAGDFNEIVFPSEKHGGAPVDTSRCNKFSSFLTDIKMIDLEGIGSKFTWRGPRFLHLDRVFKRLGQACSNAEWRLMFHEGQWNKDVFGNIHHKKNRLIGRLEGIQTAISEQNKSHLEKIEGKIKGELEQVLEQEELLWFEKRRRSKILELKDDVGNLIREDHNIARVINAYFSKLFSEENHDRPWVQTLWPKVDDETAVNLGAPISKDEVRRAFFSMKDSKAPGEDGYTAAFYKKNWEFIGEQIWRDIKYYAENPSSIEEVNGTLITLIPKVPKPMYVSQFRPISLCNVIYKGMSKIIVDMLKLTMENLVSPYQDSFVPNRQLQNNIIVAKEPVHSMGRFPDWMIGVIMASITSNRSRVLINGVASDCIVPQRGFRQGDPISPYIFVLYLGSIVKQGRYIKADYGAIKDRIRSKLDGWKSHCLSFAGRLTLVKSVIAAIPSLHMQNGLLPVMFCDEIEQIQRAFIWGDQDSRRRAHLVAWDQMYKPKDRGGLGIINLRLQNEAYIHKLAWKVLTKKDDLWVKILVAKYGRGQDLRRGIKAKSYDSKLWRDLAKCWSNFLAGLRWEITDGSEVKIWTDNWLGCEENLQQLSSNQVPWEESQKSIADYMVDDGFHLKAVHQFLESDLADAWRNLEIHEDHFCHDEQSQASIWMFCPTDSASPNLSAPW
ncbi:uncharacterized protein LOC133303550 [Gastrolobium bilobum]|uniref:uncharacterized protein LOC133303550 n=1 Tax=Gastrolobium bilobum TaxID=150636 RepID=UPI002AAF77DD|nr:uncharacterized protein LOC133303550 [Gastrolobium bilobum]